MVAIVGADEVQALDVLSMNTTVLTSEAQAQAVPVFPAPPEGTLPVLPSPPGCEMRLAAKPPELTTPLPPRPHTQISTLIPFQLRAKAAQGSCILAHSIVLGMLKCS